MDLGPTVTLSPARLPTGGAHGSFVSTTTHQSPDAWTSKSTASHHMLAIT